MNKYILIKVEDNIKRFIDKCKKYNINLYSIRYINTNSIIVKIDKNDYENIKIYNYFSKIELYKLLGKDNFIKKLYTLKYLILTFILCLIGLYFISNIILKVNVIHSNKNVRDLVYEELINNGIKKYSIKKNFNELDNIKNKILENNKEDLEWLSITNVGMTYIVRVEERILTEIKKENKNCNIISKKDALITNIYATSGEILVKNNDFVKKGDILINGNIYLNEEVSGTTCASGIVYGNVWYKTNIEIKRTYYKKVYTKKNRLNISIKNKVLRKTKYTNYDKKYIFKNKIFKLYKEKEYKLIPKKYNETDSIKKGIDELTNKFNTKLSKKGKIINTKILNKNINNNKITLEVFVVTNEIISDTEIIE